MLIRKKIKSILVAQASKFLRETLETVANNSRKNFLMALGPVMRIIQM